MLLILKEEVVPTGSLLLGLRVPRLGTSSSKAWDFEFQSLGLSVPRRGTQRVLPVRQKRDKQGAVSGSASARRQKKEGKPTSPPGVMASLLHEQDMNPFLFKLLLTQSPFQHLFEGDSKSHSRSLYIHLFRLFYIFLNCQAVLWKNGRGQSRLTSLSLEKQP